MSSNSDYLDGIPTTPNTVSDSWQPAVEQIDTTKKGFNAISLGNWDTGTTKPTVLAGGEIEAAGGVVRVDTTETILSDPGGIASGTLYLVVDFSGSDPEWYFTNDAPVWNASLNGFYEAASGSVDWRYTGHVCEWDGATAYDNKALFDITPQVDSGLRIDPDGIIFSGLNSDNAAVRLKKLTGTGPSSGGSTNYTHGLDASKVISFWLMSETATSSGEYEMWGGASGSASAITMRLKASVITVSAGSTELQGDPIKIFIAYEA